MKIRVKGWHGHLSENKAKRMDEIAVVVTPRFMWDFEGTVNSFAELWGMPFLAYPFIGDPLDINNEKVKLRTDPRDPKETHWFIYITDYPSFQAR